MAHGLLPRRADQIGRQRTRSHNDSFTHRPRCRGGGSTGNVGSSWLRGLRSQDRDVQRAEHDPAGVLGTLPVSGRDTGAVDERQRTGHTAAVVCFSGNRQPASRIVGEHGIDRRYGGARAEVGPQLTVPQVGTGRISRPVLLFYCPRTLSATAEAAWGVLGGTS